MEEVSEGKKYIFCLNSGVPRFSNLSIPAGCSETESVHNKLARKSSLCNFFLSQTICLRPECSRRESFGNRGTTQNGSLSSLAAAPTLFFPPYSTYLFYSKRSFTEPKSDTGPLLSV